MATEPIQEIDPGLFREVLGHHATGVALITGVVDGDPVGMVVGTFSSVSLDPALIAFMPTRTSHTFERLRGAESFCVNVLAADQEDLCRHFARPGDDKFADVAWSPAGSGAPVLDGAVAAIDCSYESVIEAGDHFIVLGRVRGLKVLNPVAPLLFFQGGYGRFAPASLVSYADADVVAGVRWAEKARNLMEEVAAELDVECTAFAPVADDLSIVAVAVGRNATPKFQLGSRVPLIPPLGEQYVASAGPEVSERWLGRIGGGRDSDAAEIYRERLRVARERGWSTSMGGGAPDSEVFEAVREYSGGEMTPARLAHLRAVIQEADEQYAPVEFESGRRYDIGSIAAPVKSADGRVQLVLRLAQFPSGATVEQVETWIQRLKRLAAEVEQVASESEAGLAPTV